MIDLSDEKAMLAFGARLAKQMRAGDIIALSGDLGTGKTTLARGILAGLGHDGEVPSPTFTLVQVYDSPRLLLPTWHVDLYRLEKAEEVDELGLDEALDEGALLVEWPERMGAALWPDALKLQIEGVGDEPRVLTADVPASWEKRWPR